MGYVSEIAFTHLPAGHGYEQTVLPFNDFNVMHYEFIVKSHRHNSTHFAFIVDLTNSYVGYLHEYTTSLTVSGTHVIRQVVTYSNL